MIKSLYLLLITLQITIVILPVNAEEGEVAVNEVTSVDLKYISGDDVISVLKSLIDDSISISHKDKVLLINGIPNKVKSVLPIITQIDSAPTALTIEFIASNRKIDFNPSSNTYTNINKNKTSQSMAITERQWVILKTGLSIPIAQRTRSADGTETQSFRYKKVSKSYIFKVHEFSGWSVIQVGVDSSEVTHGPVGPIEHLELNTTIVGKTGEWLEVATANKITPDGNNKIYSSSSPGKKHIHLYVKVKKPESQNIIKKDTKITQ